MTRARRDRLILDGMPLVRRIARQCASDFAPHLALEDFEQDGMLGLCQAAARCSDTSSFPAFSYFRIRGAMVDAHRRAAYREDLSPSIEGGPDRPGQSRVLESGCGPRDVLDQAQSGIFAAVWALPNPYQRIIFWRYAMDLSVEEIGFRLHLKESRVKRLHQEAIALLRPAAEGLRSAV